MIISITHTPVLSRDVDIKNFSLIVFYNTSNLPLTKIQLMLPSIMFLTSFNKINCADCFLVIESDNTEVTQDSNRFQKPQSLNIYV